MCVGEWETLAFSIIKYVMDRSVGGLPSTAHSLQSYHFPSPLSLCRWRPLLIPRTIAWALEPGRAGGLDTLWKQLLQGVLQGPTRPHPAITSSRRNLAPSLVGSTVTNTNPHPKTPLDQPRSPRPFVCRCACLGEHTEETMGDRPSVCHRGSFPLWFSTPVLSQWEPQVTCEQGHWAMLCSKCRLHT